MAAQSGNIPQAIRRFLRAPISPRSYGNLLYLLLAMPLGIFYFIFLAVGLSLGLGLAILWVGVPILLLVFLGSWGLIAIERQLAIHLLGAHVPPMSPPADPSRTVWQQIGEISKGSVIWKGLGFLLLKLPLGMVSFVCTVTLLAVSVALLLTPVFYLSAPPDLFGWEPETLGQALLCSLLGLGFAWLSLNLLNAIAWLWQALAKAALGSARLQPTSLPPSLPALG